MTTTSWRTEPAPVRAALPDLSAAAAAIVFGARLSVGPSGGLAIRPPEGVRGADARAFVDEARRTLRSVTGDEAARAALLQMLQPWPRGWGEAGAAGIVATLWAPGVDGLPAFDAAPGHRVHDVRRFVLQLRREALEGPTWTDAAGAVRWAPRVRTGAFAADVAALDTACTQAAATAALACDA